MTQDIEIVENALTSLRKAAHEQSVQYYKEQADTREYHLKKLLKNVPSVVYDKTSSDCVAHVDGVKFYIGEDGYGCVNIYADYKRLRNLFGLKWVSKEMHCFYDGYGLQKVFEMHLKALQWEAIQAQWT